MKQQISPISCGEFTLRLIQQADIPAYYEQGFAHLPEEICRLTGTSFDVSLESITNYVQQIVPDESRYDFLILNAQGKICGETVLNEIDWTLNSCNFRICLFSPDDCGTGIGQQIIPATLAIAFQKLNLQQVELEVFDFNIRAQRAYLRAGFRETARLSKAHQDADGMHDILVMQISRCDWDAMQHSKH